MEIIITILYLLLFIFIIKRLAFFRTSIISSGWFTAVFIFKTIAGILLGVIYKYYFNGGDTHLYFENAEIMFGVFKTNPEHFFKMLFAVDDPELKPYYLLLKEWENYAYFYNDSHSIIRLNALMRLFSFGIYEVHIIFFSFLSLTGLTCLFKTFIHFLPDVQKSLFASTFLVPSILFWSSGILKEGLLMFGIGTLLFSKLQMIHLGKKRYALLVLVSVIILMFLKVYVLLILLPGVIAWMWSSRSGYAVIILKFLVTYSLFIILFFNLKLISPNLDAVSIIYHKQNNSIRFTEFMKSKSIISPPVIENSLPDLLIKSPVAFSKAMFQPFVTQAHNPFSWMAAVENLMLILFLMVALIYASPPGREALPLFLLALFFVILLYALIGFTTANAGSLVRYKMPALPFLLFISIALLNRKKFRSRFKFFNN